MVEFMKCHICYAYFWCKMTLYAVLQNQQILLTINILIANKPCNSNGWERTLVDKVKAKFKSTFGVYMTLA